MNSEHLPPADRQQPSSNPSPPLGPSQSPASNAPPEALTASIEVLKILAFVALTMFLFTAAAGILLVEGLSLTTLGEIDIDMAEMQHARALRESQKVTLAALKQETTAIEQRIAARREAIKRERFGPTANAATTTSPSPPSGDSGQRSAAVNDKRSAPDAVTTAFLSLERQSSASAAALQQLSDAERHELARIIVAAMNTGVIAPQNAIVAIQSVGNDEEQAALLRPLVKNLKYLDFNDTTLIGMVNMCRCLPERERAAHLLVLLHSINRIRGEMIPQAIMAIPESDVPKLATLLTHPMPEVRETVRQRMSADQMWTALLPAVGGKDYAMFVAAFDWISQQQPSDLHRKSLLAALRDVIWFRNDGEHAALDVYVAWADESESTTILKSLAEPIPGVAEAEALMETARRIGLPVARLIENSQGLAESQLFAHYLQGDVQLETAVAEFLQSDGLTDKRMRWMTWISESGSSSQLQDLAAAAAHIQRANPQTVLSNQANQLLDVMKARLSGS